MRSAIFLLAFSLFAQLPKPAPDGYFLPNGWRITPLGKAIPTEDMLLNLLPAPDGKAVVALHGGFNPHGLVVIDTATEVAAQRIKLKSAWLGMAWSPDGTKLYVSGGNAAGPRPGPTPAPIYVFTYADGKLSDAPVRTFKESIPAAEIYWSGVAHHPKTNTLYAANRGAVRTAGHVVIFDSATGALRKRVLVEASPYDLVLSPDGATLYVSNWSSDSISVIDTASEKVVATIAVGDNPNDMELHSDGRLFVSCANENTVYVVDTAKRRATERISVALHEGAPVGATPNALLLDRANSMLFVANADNNAIAVVRVAEAGESEVVGFIPSGWYPSSLAMTGKQRSKLWIGNSKGLGSYSNIRGPHSPLPPGEEGKGSIKSLQKGSVNIMSLASMKSELKKWTRARLIGFTPVGSDEPLQQSSIRKPRRSRIAR